VDERLLDLFGEVWISRCYTPACFDVAAGDTVVDIGANVGVFTLWAASRDPHVRVIALEPSLRICDFLRRNVCANGLDNVTVIQAAAGGQKGEAILYSRGPEAWNTLYCRDNFGSMFRPLARTEVVTLDDLFDRFAVWKCSLLKLDCEGAEYEVLLNARPETLNRIGNIAMEYHVGLNEHSPEELVAFLESHGFAVECLPLIDQECGYLYARRRASLEFVGSEQARASGFGWEGGNDAAA
jgi:FkbM family methyltransferase